MLVLSSMNFRHALLAHRTSVQRLAGNPGDPLQASDERDPSLTPLIAATYPPVLLPRMAACRVMGYFLASPLRLAGACVKESESLSHLASLESFCL